MIRNKKEHDRKTVIFWKWTGILLQSLFLGMYRSPCFPWGSSFLSQMPSLSSSLLWIRTSSPWPSHRSPWTYTLNMSTLWVCFLSRWSYRLRPMWWNCPSPHFLVSLMPAYYLCWFRTTDLRLSVHSVKANPAFRSKVSVRHVQLVTFPFGRLTFLLNLYNPSCISPVQKFFF